MLILNLMAIHNQGTVILLNGSEPDLIDVVVGTTLQQGENTWVVKGIEVNRRVVSSVSPPVPGKVGLLLIPITPMPIKGEIQKVSP